jgi:hypothetical protein
MRVKVSLHYSRYTRAEVYVEGRKKTNEEGKCLHSRHCMERIAIIIRDVPVSRVLRVVHLLLPLEIVIIHRPLPSKVQMLLAILGRNSREA